MNRLLLLTILIGLGFYTSGQSLSKSVISPYGTIAQAGGPSLSATLGQSASATLASGNHFLQLSLTWIINNRVSLYIEGCRVQPFFVIVSKLIKYGKEL